MKAFLLFLALPLCLSAQEWVADLYPAPQLLAKEASSARIALPKGFAAGRVLSLALRSVDVFGNVSTVSNVITGRMPADVGGQVQPALEGLVTPASAVTGTLEPVLPAPADFAVRLDPQSGLLLLRWTAVTDPELVGYQLVRNAAAAPLIPPPPEASEIRKLAVWDFPSLGEGEDFLPAEAWLAAQNDDSVARPELVLGPGLKRDGNRHYNQHAIYFSTGTFGDDADGPERYVGFTLRPQPGRTLALSGLTVGLWGKNQHGTPSFRLEYSLDGFETRHEVPLVLQGEIQQEGMGLGAGVPAIANLADELPLRALRVPVEFRIFVWGIHNRGIGKLGVVQDPPRDDPDLILEGALR